MNLILALAHQGRILGKFEGISLGRPEQAIPVLERAFDLADALVHLDPNDQGARGRLAMTGLDLGDLLRDRQPRRALAIYDHVLQHMAEIANNSSFRRFEVSALVRSSYALRRLASRAKAQHRLDDAFERLRKEKLYPVAEKERPASEVDEALRGMADGAADERRFADAIQIYQNQLREAELESAKPKSQLRDALDTSLIYTALSALYKQAKQEDDASEMDARRRALWQAWEAKLPQSSFVRRQLGGG